MTRPAPLRPLRALPAALLVALSLIFGLVASPGQAQFGLGGVGGSGPASEETPSGAGSDTAAADPAADPADDPAAALLRVLEDPAARDKLIGALRQSDAGAAGGGGGATGTASQGSATSGTATSGTDASTTPAAASGDVRDETVALGRQAAELTQQMAETVADFAFGLWNQISLAPARLAELRSVADPGVILGALQELAAAIIATYAVFVLLRLAARPLRRKLGVQGIGAGWLRTLMLSLAVAALDAVIVLAAWAAGYAIVTLAMGAPGQIGLRQTLYLNAFVAIEIARIVIRFALRPDTGALRLIPFPDRGAQALAWRLTAAAGILGYGHLLAAPIVAQEIGWRAAAALGTVVSLTVVLLAMAATLRHRRDVAAWLTPNDAQSGRTFGGLARLWHIPVMIYLLALFVIVLIRPGGVLFPVLQASGQVVAAIVIGIIINHMLATWARRGVRLPERATSTLPLLERRLNAFVPKILLLVRVLVVASILLWALQVAGITQLGDWLATDLGVRLTAGLVSVAMILIGAFAVWLAMTSWIDWRLNPDVGAAPTPRETTLLSLLRNAATILLAVITLMFSLSELGIDIAPLIASAGVLGLAIGFGAQKLVQDVITGVFIQLENAMNVGDVVTANGITGGVEKLTVRSVSIRDLDGTFHLIPFSSVDAVSNLTRDFSFAVFDMGIAYREDIDEAKQAIVDAFDELMTDPAFAVQTTGPLEWFGVQALGDSAVVLRCRVKTLPGKQWGLLRAINERVKKVFDARGIEIPFPHQTMYFGINKDGSAPALHMVRDDAETAANAMAVALAPRAIEAAPEPEPEPEDKKRTRAPKSPGSDLSSGTDRDMPDDDET